MTEGNIYIGRDMPVHLKEPKLLACRCKFPRGLALGNLGKYIP